MKKTAQLLLPKPVLVIAMMLAVSWHASFDGSISWAQEHDFEAEHVGDWFDLFNGHDLTGWEQKNGSAIYKVIDGTIEGTTAEGSPNSFMCTTRDFADFELMFEVKVDSELNSGVQIRSRSINEFKQGRVHGPQVEVMLNPGASGYVYSEGTGRGWLSGSDQVEKTKSDREVTDAYKNDAWNQYRVLAIGDRIQTWVNGVPVADLVDSKSSKVGFIGLQVHSIPAGKGPYKVAWKNIKVRELNVELAHSFIGFGKANQVAIVSESGDVEWSMPLPASDGWVLADGNILLAIYPCKKYPKGAVIEVERESKKIVFEYKGQQKEISTAQKISPDQYLIAELGPKPKAIVVSKDGAVESETALACQKQNIHMQTRMLRMLPNGNYIAPHLLDFAVKEYDPKTGEVVREIPTDERGREKRDWPFTAIRMENGNTVIGCTNGNRVIEVDSEGEIVWSVTNEDLGENLISDACGVQRLPNGNTVISSYYSKGDSVKLFEVTPEKKVVWRYTGMKAGFHNFQILSTNGRGLSAAYR